MTIKTSFEFGVGWAAARLSGGQEAPAACKAEPVNGLVLISLKDGSGGGRIAMGAGRWHWQDLLGRQPYGR